MLDLEAIARIAQAHRGLAGVELGVELSDAQCRHLRALVEGELERAGVEHGRREWFTGLRLDGSLCGAWGRSWLEAALVSSQAGAGLAWLVADPSLEVRAQYAAGRDAGARYPVTDRPLSRAELAMLDVPPDALF